MLNSFLHFRHMETRKNNSISPWSRTQTLKNKPSSESTEMPSSRRISLRSSFRLKSKKKSKKSTTTGDNAVNADSQELQKMVPEVVEKTNLDNNLEEQVEEGVLSENKQQHKEKSSTCQPCCVIS